MESKEISVKRGSCEVSGQKSKFSYRHAELRAVKVKKLGMFRPAYHCLDLLCSQEWERKKLIPLFSFSLQQLEM